MIKNLFILATSFIIFSCTTIKIEPTPYNLKRTQSKKEIASNVFLGVTEVPLKNGRYLYHLRLNSFSSYELAESMALYSGAIKAKKNGNKYFYFMTSLKSQWCHIKNGSKISGGPIVNVYVYLINTPKNSNFQRVNTNQALQKYSFVNQVQKSNHSIDNLLNLSNIYIEQCKERLAPH